MESQAAVTLEGTQIRVSGQVSFQNVVQLCNQGLDYLLPLPQATIDFQDLKLSDSSILSLLVEWLRFAHKSEKDIFFTNIPSFMYDLARVSGLDTILQHKVR